MRRRKLPILLAVALVGAAMAAAVWLRARAAPEAARLLPEAEGFLYVNLEPMRKAGVMEQPAMAREAEYERFVRETGFQFERDLDEAAFAIHSAPAASPAGTAQQTRYSEIFVGHFDMSRAVAYFHKTASAMERYREVDIFSIPLEGRTVRVALLGVDMVGVSNTEGPQVIHGMVDRYKQLAMPFGGPSLLRQFYGEVPFGTLAWAIARVAPENEQNKLFVLPGGFDLFFPPGTVMVASVRYSGAAQLRVEALTSGEEQARRVAEQANAFLAVFRGLEVSTQPHGPDDDVKQFFESLKIEQDKDRAVLDATLPAGFLKKMLSEPPVETAAPPAPQPEKKPAPRPRGKRNK